MEKTLKQMEAEAEKLISQCKENKELASILRAIRDNLITAQHFIK